MQDMSALIAALEAARSALDTIEAEAVQQRKAKKMPPVKVEIEGPAEDVAEGGMEE